jgi:hypothetical protein
MRPAVEATFPRPTGLRPRGAEFTMSRNEDAEI